MKKKHRLSPEAQKQVDDIRALAKQINDPEWVAAQIAKLEDGMPALRQRMETRAAEADAAGDNKTAKACRDILSNFEQIITNEKTSLALRTS